MPSLGLSLGLGGVRVLGAAGPIYDPDAAAWFEAVEATGATFGPDPATITANKTAWSDWVIAQKNAESPIAGRSNWDQLTEPGEGFIQPLMGLSTFNVPALFGGRTFTGFVDGYYIPALGIKGGEGKSLLTNRSLSATPLNDVALGMWVTGAASTSGFFSITGTSRDAIFTSGLFRSRNTQSGTNLTAYNGGPFPRAAFLSRHLASEFLAFGVAESPQTIASSESTSAPLVFFAATTTTAFSDVRSGLAFYGRSINLAAMNTACVALSEAITWPT